ncbi:MAG TPA: sigma-70 family RNA polymerase sigma factor [Isosphaeraceae bacterium]|nr:sigma-70 family RNA polymerase sigma factor [Isosphaeraceae bacterium]
MSRRTRRQTTSGSTLKIYLQEIKNTPLLSAAEEQELAGRVAAGNPYARDHMIKANLRLVVNIARGYVGKGLCLEDLIEEGNLGLIRAVEGFDGAMDTRFSTYASFWIKQSIRGAVMKNGKPIRLPGYMVKLLSKWQRANYLLRERLGRTPTPDEVGKSLKLSKKRIGMVAKAIQVNELMSHPDEMAGYDFRLDNMLIDERAKAPEAILIESDDVEWVLDRLDDRGATVIRMRFGLEPYSPMTLHEVGEKLGLTRERVRQLEKEAMERLMEAV